MEHKPLSSKVYIDCGFHDGKSLESYIAEGWEVHGFEPNPGMYNMVLNRFRNLVSCHLYNKAVWIHNARIRLHITKRSESCSLYTRSDVGEIGLVSVECIDFGEWIRKAFSRDDYIVLKLDIEGAEFKVLKKMLDDGSINYIDKVFVEWHNNLHSPNRFPKWLNVKLEEMIKARGVKFNLWKGV